MSKLVRSIFGIRKGNRRNVQRNPSFLALHMAQVTGKAVEGFITQK